MIDSNLRKASWLFARSCNCPTFPPSSGVEHPLSMGDHHDADGSVLRLIRRVCDCLTHSTFWGWPFTRTTQRLFYMQASRLPVSSCLGIFFPRISFNLFLSLRILNDATKTRRRYKIQGMQRFKWRMNWGGWVNLL